MFLTFSFEEKENEDVNELRLIFFSSLHCLVHIHWFILSCVFKWLILSLYHIQWKSRNNQKKICFET